MRFGSKLAGWVVLGTVIGVGCIGQEPGANVDFGTEKPVIDVRFDVTGAVFGSAAATKELAEQAHEQACALWAAEIEGQSPGSSVESFDCGTKISESGSDWQFSSSAVAHLVTTLPEGTTPQQFTPGVAQGASGSKLKALDGWKETCAARLARVKATYGDRLLAGTCSTPRDVGQGNYKYSSDLLLWIAPSTGTSLEVTQAIVGFGPQKDTADAAWQDECDAWLNRVVETSGQAHIGDFTCGAPVDKGSGEYRYETTASARLSFELVDGSELVVTDLALISGDAGDRKTATVSWRERCDEAIANAKVVNGDRFLAASCGVPKDVGSGNYRFESTAKLWLGDRAVVTAEEEAGGSGGGGGIEEIGGATTEGEANAGGAAEAFDDSVSPPENCHARCVAMMEACDAGPIEETCGQICTDDSTENELQCAEAWGCEGISGWFQVCGLGFPPR